MSLSLNHLGIDLLSSEFIADPYPSYERLRQTSPILYDADWGLWFISSYEDINALLRDRRLGRDMEGAPKPDPRTPFGKLHHNSLMEKEPPDHTRLRGLVNRAFTPARVEALRPHITAIAHRLIDAVQARGEMDLLADFAEPLPVMVIAELLGVPEEGRVYLRPWSQAIVAMYELAPTPEDEQRANRAVTEFSTYLQGLVAERRVAPREDLISALIEAEEEGHRLSEDELIATCILMLNAGHEATVNAIANGMLAFFRHPDQYELLKRSPELIKTAVEEVLRYDTPLQMFRRWVRENVEYKDLRFEKGSRLALLYAAGNRDPARFPDPHRLDITRQDNPHLGFGAGLHYCVGAPLARLEMQVAFQALLERLPNLRLASEKLEYRPNFVIRGLKALPVRF
ncbi:MAG: cytochrome P450 [Anaerolineales bacterium]|nr:cytochrome P450 [Anaerolineales bacterium]MDW8447612.1 cytochrome P450 [Anaerolineales bacterium]